MMFMNPARIEHRADGAWLIMPCPTKSWCEVPVSREPSHVDPVRGPVWRWDGNEQAPTIDPSIGCDTAPRCGQHRVVTAGRW